jgi:tRNA pseudouridine55 synthase
LYFYSYLSGSKAYIATGKFGYETTTLDADPTGTIIKEETYDHITEDMVHTTIQSTQFLGDNVQQIPPLYSALKKDGKPYYEYARTTTNMTKLIQELNIQPRTITISTIQLLKYDKINGEFIIYVECGGGTYIRSLIRDIAYSLNTVATMTQLQRTKQGQFVLQQSDNESSSVSTYNYLSSTDYESNSIILNDILDQSDWNPTNVYSALERWKNCTKTDTTKTT